MASTPQKHPPANTAVCDCAAAASGSDTMSNRARTSEVRAIEELLIMEDVLRSGRSAGARGRQGGATRGEKEHEGGGGAPSKNPSKGKTSKEGGGPRSAGEMI